MTLAQRAALQWFGAALEPRPSLVPLFLVVGHDGGQVGFLFSRKMIDATFKSDAETAQRAFEAIVGQLRILLLDSPLAEEDVTDEPPQ